MTEKVLQEITEKRDRYTKHFMLPEKELPRRSIRNRFIMRRKVDGKKLITGWKQYQRMEKSATRIRHLTYRYVLRSRQERIRL